MTLDPEIDLRSVVKEAREELVKKLTIVARDAGRGRGDPETCMQVNAHLC